MNTKSSHGITCLLLFLSAFSAAAGTDSTHEETRSLYFAPEATAPMIIDGRADETDWKKAAWRELNQRWLGPEYTVNDFQGRYKVVWTQSRLYILSEIVDDVLVDSHRDPLAQYWDDDSLEIFLDEDRSGGDHQFNHNAFAYHLSLDNRAIDIGTDRMAHDYSHHVESRWQQIDQMIIWEAAIDVYSDTYIDGADNNKTSNLSAGKTMGFMVAYCDNDGSELRENFIGSERLVDDSRERGWIDADLFGSLTLVE